MAIVNLPVDLQYIMVEDVIKFPLRLLLLLYFTRAMLTTQCRVCLSVCLSVCPSVCHKLVFYWNS